jgi:hypothetical protein
MLLSNPTCFDERSLYWLSVSSGVRINQNGFMFFNSPVYMPQGTSYPCPRTLDGLCQQGNYTFLPCSSAPRTMVTDAPPPFDKFWKAETKCYKTPSMYHFDIMPCDLRSGTSIVWSEGVVSVQHDLDLNYWTNLFVLLIMVWLIVNLGESMALILEVKGSTPHNHNTVVLCIALVALIASNTPDGFWATHHDITLYWCTIGYIGLYALYHIENRNTVNVIIGCMMLVSARFYQTNETPYVATYLFLIATRFIQKFYYALWGKSDLQGQHWLYIRYFYMAADAALFVLLYIFSFIPAFHEPAQAHLYLLGLLFSAFCLGSFIANYVRSKQVTST